MVFFWIGFLRLGYYPGILSWLLVVATVLLSLKMQRGLARHLWAQENP